MINIEAKQKEIDATNFWDAWVWDVQISYFGDEITIVYEDKGTKCWKLTFLLVGKVDYNNDIMWSNARNDDAVKTFKKNEVTYSAQEISIKSYDDKFIECFIEFIQLQMAIVCRDIKVEHCDMSDFHFFWQDNEDKED